MHCFRWGRAGCLLLTACVDLGMAQSHEECATQIRMHAFASRAQFQCNFSRYNQEIIDAAAACARLVGEPAAKSALRDGMALFDQRASEMGVQPLCEDVLEKLPMVVGR